MRQENAIIFDRNRRLEGPVGDSGFVLIESFCDEAEVEAISGHIDQLYHLPHDPTCARAHNTLLPLRWRDQIVEMVLASPRRIQRLRNAVDGWDLKWISGYVSIKEPHSAPLAWHQDWWCWDHPVSLRRSAPQVAVLFYLQDTDATNAALRVVPASHVQACPILAELPEPHSDPKAALAPGHPALSDLPGQVTIPLKAGDAVVIDYRLLHGTHANTTSARRDCVLFSFTPSWRDLPVEIRSHLISHPALPNKRESPPPRRLAAVLPRFDGVRRDLCINRTPPLDLRIVGSTGQD